MSFVLFNSTKRMTGWLALSVICTGLVGCNGGGGDSPRQDNTIGVSPVQVFYDASVESFDNIVSPSTANGTTVLSPADIVKAQTDFDQIADSLLQR